MRSESESVRVSEDIITDPLTYVRAIATNGGDSHPLTSAGAWRSLFDLHRYQHKQHWTGLKLQGKLSCLSSGNHSVSHSYLKNTALSEDIVIFTVKARLQVLPTRLNLSIWFPTTQVPHCLHHTSEQITETLPHILNGCHVYKGMYISRHNRIVDLKVKDISNNLSPLIRVYKHSSVNPSMFQYLNNNSEMFSDLSANTPDVVVIDEECREVFVLEIACTFNSSMEEVL